MVDPLPSNQTTSPWNPSPRRTCQTCQPGSSPCYCSSRAMITSSATTPLRKWPCLTPSLSLFSPHPGPDIPLDIAIHHACLSPEQKEAFQQAFVSDPEMCTLTDIIITSWPDDSKVVQHPLCPYWQHHDNLTIEDGLVLHGEALIIPPLEGERILHQLLQFHQGITKCQLLVCRCVFWPGINKAIEEFAHQCETCTQFQAQNTAAPWQMCASDIFTLKGADYLICGDFYFKMILI